MTTITNSLEASEKIIQVANQLGDVINGTSTEVVATDSGDIPTVRKALSDSMLIKDPLLWDEGSDEVDPLQPRTFTGGIIYWAPNATSLTPVPMGVTPVGDDNWKIAPVNANNVIDTLVDNQGEWDNTKTVKKGQIWSYQDSQWRSLTGVSGVAPSAGDWRKIIDQKDVTVGQEELIGGNIFPEKGDLEVGMTVPNGTTYLRVDGAIYAMSPIATGSVTVVTSTGAEIGGVTVYFETLDRERLAFRAVETGGVVVGRDVYVTQDTHLKGGLTVNSGVIHIASGVTLTVDGFIYAPRQKIFEFEDSTSKVYTSDIPQYGVSTKFQSVIYPEWFGAATDAKAPDNEPSVSAPSTGTDSTDAFKRAILLAQMSCMKFPQITKPPKPIVQCGYNSSYLINGENALGCQISDLDDGVKYRSDTWFTFDGNGCTLYWNVPTPSSSLAGRLNKLHRPEYKNFSIVGTGFSGSAGYLFTWEPSSGYSPSIEGSFHKIKVKGGQLPVSTNGWGIGNSFERIFNVSGNIVHDRMTVSECSFQNFKALHYSENQEAVSWSYQECSAIPAVEDAVIIYQNNRFSGGLDFIGGDILFKENNQKLIYARYDEGGLDKSFYGEMYIRSRIETVANKNITLVDATHGTYTLEGFNITAGNAAPSSLLVAAKLGIDANVYFRNARIPRQFFVQAATDTEWNDFLSEQPDRAKQVHCYNCETIDGGVNFQIFDKSTDSVVDWRTALEGNRHVRPCHFEGFGGKNIVYSMQSYDYDRPNTVSTYGYYNNGFEYINNPTDNSYYLQMPPKSFISELLVNAGAVSASVADRLGVWCANTLITTVPLSASSKIKVDAVGDSVGIALPNNFGSSLLKLSIKPMLGGDTLGDIVAAQVEGFAKVKYDCIDSRLKLPAVDVPTLV